MKQVVQDARSGKLELVEVPAPAAGPGQVLVRNHFSVVSPGTELMALRFARKSLVGKARSRPDLVAQVTRKLRHEGPLPTYRAVMTRLDAPQPLGYACAGVVEAVGPGVSGFAPGDRVACAGAGYANHAEWVAVPENLVARAPDGLPLRKAAFATLGAIALQGLRVAGPTLGEFAAVIGLGLIGQLTVQLLHANGCRVLGIDLDPTRVKQALDQGAEWGAAPGDDHGAWTRAATEGAGADFSIVTAASNDAAPIHLAAELCRHKGRIVLVGATGMELERRALYEKELELRMSMSYGPGRYDRRYEEEGLDYPLAHVRWTENRNLKAYLALADSGGLDPDRLDPQEVPFETAEQAYEELAGGERSALAMVFRYDPEATHDRVVALATRRPGPAILQPGPASPQPGPATPQPGPVREQVGVAFLGAGNYAKGVLLPALKKCPNVRAVSIVTATGPSARRSAERFGFAECGTDPDAVLRNDGVDLVFVATRHDSHAALAAAALRAGKAVWLEKPAALGPAELDDLAAAARETAGFLTVGYNRRFSAHARGVREAFQARRGPLAIHYTVAAGPPPAGTWILDPAAGGGRTIGEICHFVDLCGFLVGASPTAVFARSLGRDPQLDDSLVATLGYPDGSTATLQYLASASPALPKERWEASCDGRTAICENFRVTRILGGRTIRTMNQDKGQATAVAETIEAVRSGGPAPLALEEIVAVSRATFAMEKAARAAETVEVTDADG